MPNDLIKLRRLMKAANQIRKNKPVILRGAEATQSQALKYAWWFEGFRTRLSEGKYRFSYVKLDGHIREAVGTLDMSLIPAEHHPKGLTDSEAKSYNAFAYYDLGKGEWRSFRLDNFIGFVEQVG